MGSIKTTTLEFVMTTKNGQQFMQWLRTQAGESSKKMTELEGSIRKVVDAAKNADPSIKNKTGLLNYAGEDRQIKNLKTKLLELTNTYKQVQQAQRMWEQASTGVKTSVDVLTKAADSLSNMSLKELRQAQRQYQAMLGNIGKAKNGERDSAWLRSVHDLMAKITARVRELEQGQLAANEAAQNYLNYMRQSAGERQKQSAVIEEHKNRLRTLSEENVKAEEKMAAAQRRVLEATAERAQKEAQLHTMEQTRAEGMEVISANEQRIAANEAKSNEILAQINKQIANQTGAEAKAVEMRQKANISEGEFLAKKKAQTDEYQKQLALASKFKENNMISVTGKVTKERLDKTTAGMNEAYIKDSNELARRKAEIEEYKQAVKSTTKELEKLTIPKNWQDIMTKLSAKIRPAALTDEMVAQYDRTADPHGKIASMLQNMEKQRISVIEGLKQIFNSKEFAAGNSTIETIRARFEEILKEIENGRKRIEAAAKKFRTEPNANLFGPITSTYGDAKNVIGVNGLSSLVRSVQATPANGQSRISEVDNVTNLAWVEKNEESINRRKKIIEERVEIDQLFLKHLRSFLQAKGNVDKQLMADIDAFESSLLGETGSVVQASAGMKKAIREYVDSMTAEKNKLDKQTYTGTVSSYTKAAAEHEKVAQTARKAAEALTEEKNAIDSNTNSLKKQNAGVRASIASDEKMAEASKAVVTAKREETKAKSTSNRAAKEYAATVEKNVTAIVEENEWLAKNDTVIIKTAEDMLTLINTLKKNNATLSESSQQYVANQRTIQQLEVEYSKFVLGVGQKVMSLESQSVPALMALRKHFENIVTSAHALPNEIENAKISLREIDRMVGRNMVKESMGMLDKRMIQGLSQGELRQYTQQLEKYLDVAALVNKERTNAIKTMERANQEMAKTAQSDVMTRMAMQYKYMARSQRNLSTMTDEALRRQQQFWLQQSTMVENGSAKERTYTERFRETTKAIIERQNRQQALRATESDMAVQSLSQTKVNELTREQLGMVKQNYEYKELTGRITNEELARLQEIRKLEFDRTQDVKRRAELIQQEREQMAAEQYIQQPLNMLRKEELEIAKRVYTQRVMTNNSQSDKAALQKILAEENRRLEVMKEQTAEIERQKLAGTNTGTMSVVNAGVYKSIEHMKQLQKELMAYREKMVDPRDAKSMEAVDNAILRVTNDIRIANGEIVRFSEANARVREIVESRGNASRQGSERSREALQEEIYTMERMITSLKSAIEYFRKLRKTASMNEAMASLNAATGELEKMKAELNGVSATAKKTEVDARRIAEVIKNPAAVASLKELKAAYNYLKNEIDNANNAQLKYNEVAGKMRAIDAQIRQIQGSIHHVDSGMKKMIDGVKSYAQFYFGVFAIIMRIQNVVRKNKELSDSIANVAKVSNQSEGAINHLVTRLQSIDTRTATSELMKLAEQAAKLGIQGTEAIEQFVRAADKIVKTLGEDIGGAEAVADLVKLNDLINDNSGSLEEGLNRMGSAILAVGNNSAASYANVVSFLRQTGATASVSNTSTQQLVALGATFSSLGAKIDQSATSINKMLMGIQKNAFEVARTVGLSGVELQKMVSNGQAFEALIMVADRLKELGDAGENTAQNISKVLKAIGGRQNVQMTTALSLLVTNTSRLREELGYANKAYEEGTLMTQEYERVQNTLAGQIQKIGKIFTDTFTNPQAISALKQIVGVFGFFVKVITDWSAIAVFAVAWMARLTRQMIVFNVATQASLAGAGSLRLIFTGLLTMIPTLIRSLTSFFIFVFSGMNAMTAGAWTATLGMKALHNSIQVVWAGVKKIPFYGWVMMLASALYLLKDAFFGETETDKTVKSIADAGNEAEGAVSKMNKLANELTSLKEQVDSLAEAYNSLEQQTGKTIVEIEEQIDKTGKLTEKDKQQKEAKDALSKAQVELKTKLDKFNSTYSRYLGFQITDLNNTNLLIEAKRKLSAELRKEAYEKARSQRLEAIVTKFGEPLNDEGDDLYQALLTALDKRGLAGSTNSDYGDVVSFISKYVGEQVDNNRDLLNSKDYDNLYWGIVKILRDNHGLPGADFTAYNIVGKNLLRKNIDEYADVLIEMETEKKRVDNQFNAMIKSEDEKSKAADANIKAGRAKAVNSDIDRLNTGEITVEALIKEKGTAFITELQYQIDEAKRNWYNSQNSSEAAQYQKKVQEYMGIMNKVEEYNRAQLRESVWGKDASEFNKLNPQQIKEVHDALDKAHGLIKDGTSVDEIASALASEMDTTSPLARLRDSLIAETATRKAAGMNDSEIAEMQRKMIDAIDHQVKERAKAIHVNFEGNLSHPSEGGGKSDIQQAKDDFNAYVKRLDDYYVRKQMEIEQDRARGLLIAETYERMTSDLEKEHLENRAKLENMFLVGKRYDEDQGRLTANQMKIFFNEFNGTEAQYRAAMKTFDKTKALLQKLGDAFLDEIRLKSDKDRLEIIKIIKKNRDAFEKAVVDLRPLQKLYNDILANFDGIGLFNTLRSSDIQRRATTVFQLIREAYQYGAEGIRDALDNVNEQMNWGLTETQKEVMVARIEAYAEQYEDTIRKQASNIKKRLESMYKVAAPGGISYEDRKNLLLSKFEGMKSRYATLEGRGAGGSYLGMTSQDSLAYRQQRAKVALAERELQDMQERYEKELAMKQTDEERFALQQSYSIVEAEKRKEINELMREQVSLQEQMASKVVSHLKEYEDVAGELMKTLSEQGGFFFNADGGPLTGMDAAKMAYNRNRGISQERSEYVVYKGDGTYETKWMTEEQRMIEERDIAAKNARIEATNKALQEWGEKMAKDITEAFQRSFNERITERSAEQQAEAERKQMTKERIDYQSEQERQFTELFKSELQKRMDALMAYVNKVDSLTERQGKGNRFEEVEDGGNAGEVALGASSSIAVVADAATAAAQRMPVGENELTVPYKSGDEKSNGTLSGFDVEQTTGQLDGLKKDIRSVAKEGKEAMNETKKVTTSAFTDMIQGANLYGIVYSAVMNDNMTASQKAGLIAVQSAGQMAMSIMSALLSQMIADVAVHGARGTARAFGDMPLPAAIAAVAAITAAIGAATALATKKVAKSKKEVAQITGTSSGRITTGMLTYATGRYMDDQGRIVPGMMTFEEGYNVGAVYSVDGRDGRAYDAKYVGRIRKTGIQKGVSFGIFSEVKPEMVIDGDTTDAIHNRFPEVERAIYSIRNRGTYDAADLISPNYSLISRSIETLYRNRILGGVPTFAAGNYPYAMSQEAQEVVAQLAGGISAQQVQALTETLVALQTTLAGGIRASVDRSQASRSLRKQMRYERRNGIRDGLNG